MEQLSTLFELATTFHSCRDVESLLNTFAARMARSLSARAALVWLPAAEADGLVCRGRWFETGFRFEPEAGGASKGAVVDMFEATQARALGGKEIRADALAHLAASDRERVKTALYAPLPGSQGVVGVLEVLNKKSGTFTAEEAALAEEASRLTGRALEAVLSLEEAQHGQLGTIERLTALYDISRHFNSTLELEALLPIVAEKIGDILGAQACNLWLVDSEADELYLAQKAGEDPTTREEERTPLGEGFVGQVAQQGEPRLAENAQGEELLAARQAGQEDYTLRSLMCAPLLKEEEVLGVVEVVNKLDGTRFDDDALFFLASVSEQAAIALNNANLLEAERKVHELDALLAISKEITSTLDLDRVLTTVVHQAATVVPFDRCVIGLFDRNRFVLGAVSGEAEVPRTREMDQLRDILAWVAEQPEAVSADQYEEGWEVQPEEGRERLVRYLEENDSSGFYAVPLRDDQGRVGVLALLSSEADFLSESHLEVLSILANQTTVAIRNARLYHEVPLMSLWQPLVERKRKLQAMPYGRWLELGWRVGLVALLLVGVPWKMRVVANATVVPAERRVVSAEVEGVIQRVYVREGDRVAAGDELAELDASDNRLRWERAQANLAVVRHQRAEAEARRELGIVRQARLRMGIHQAEAELYREKVEKARLLAPIGGVVVTPKVEEKVGELLTTGETFCELVDPERMAVEMNVPETQVNLIRPEAAVALKLNAFPARTFTGWVERVSAQTITAEGEQFFVVRALFLNPDGVTRTGMVGRGKIVARGGWFGSGWYPVGYVFLRTPVSWAWRKAWSWLP
ncbi:MAG: GAF domain-containing protein [Terriglobia bacterium]